MRAIKYRELRRMYELNGPRQTVQHLNEALGEGHLRPEDFSIRDLAEATLGTQRVRALDPRHGEYVLEAGDGVDVTAFSNIAGQVVQAKVLEAYRQEAFVLSRWSIPFRPVWTANAYRASAALPTRRPKSIRACRIRTSVSAKTILKRRRRPSGA